MHIHTHVKLADHTDYAEAVCGGLDAFIKTLTCTK